MYETGYVYYSPMNTSARSYTTNETEFIASKQKPVADSGSAGIEGVRSAVASLPRTPAIIAGVIIGAVFLDLIMNRGQVTIHRKLPEHMMSGGVGGAIGKAI